MKIDRLDHLVLTVKNIEATCEFYIKVLGREVITFRNGRIALKFGNQKLNLREVENELSPKALLPTPGSADLCFISSEVLCDVIKHLHACQVDIIKGPVKKTGAMGTITSVYIRDPDQNLIEVASYEI